MYGFQFNTIENKARRMKEIKVVKPVFVKDFQCVGSECRDHCCKGWNINLDKPAVKRYKNSKNIDIKNIASTHIAITKVSIENWGSMKLDNQGVCAYFEDGGLCKVHKELGASALSNTCSTYPRTKISYNREEHESLSLSCPEATRLLLTNPKAMLFSEFIKKKYQRNISLNNSQQIILYDLMDQIIIRESGAKVEEGMYSLAEFYMYHDKVADFEDKVNKLELYFSTLLEPLRTGVVSRKISQIKPDYMLQWALLLRLQKYLSLKSQSRSWAVLNHYVNKLVYIQAKSVESGDYSGAMKLLKNSWDTKVFPWISSHPHIINNYIQYRIYNNTHHSKKRSLLKSLYLLAAEWFLIKSLISASAELTGAIGENEVINIIYSYHAITKHDPNSEEAFLNEIEKTKVNDDLSLIYLLT